MTQCYPLNLHSHKKLQYKISDVMVLTCCQVWRQDPSTQECSAPSSPLQLLNATLCSQSAHQSRSGMATAHHTTQQFKQLDTAPNQGMTICDLRSEVHMVQNRLNRESKKREKSDFHFSRSFGSNGSHHMQL